jgi:hypothetical protein
MASEEGAEQIEVEVMDEVAAAGEEEGSNMGLIIGGVVVCLILLVVLVVGGLWAMGMICSSSATGTCAVVSGNPCNGKKKDEMKDGGADFKDEACTKEKAEDKCNAVVLKEGDKKCCEFKAEEPKKEETAK